MITRKLHRALVWQGIGVYADREGNSYTMSKHFGLLYKKIQYKALGWRAKKRLNRSYGSIVIGTTLKSHDKQIYKQLWVHRVVCQAFHGEPPFPKAQVDHINGDMFDNRPENLRWCTAQENRRNSKFYLARHPEAVLARQQLIINQQNLFNNDNLSD